MTNNVEQPRKYANHVVLNAIHKAGGMTAKEMFNAGVISDGNTLWGMYKRGMVTRTLNGGRIPAYKYHAAF